MHRVCALRADIMSTTRNKTPPYMPPGNLRAAHDPRAYRDWYVRNDAQLLPLHAEGLGCLRKRRSHGRLRVPPLPARLPPLLQDLAQEPRDHLRMRAHIDNSCSTPTCHGGCKLDGYDHLCYTGPTRHTGYSHTLGRGLNPRGLNPQASVLPSELSGRVYQRLIGRLPRLPASRDGPACHHGG